MQLKEVNNKNVFKNSRIPKGKDIAHILILNLRHKAYNMNHIKYIYLIYLQIFLEGFTFFKVLN